MTRRLLLAFALVSLLVPADAGAGGWWTYIDLDRSTVAVGERVNAKAEVLFASARAGRVAEAEQPYHVYLLRGVDHSMVVRAMSTEFRPDWWTPDGADAYRAGRVVVDAFDANMAVARASFVVPELPEGTYALMFCDEGCARPLADIVPTERFTVVGDPATARLSDRVDGLEERLERQGRQVAATRATLRAARAAAANSRRDVKELQATMRRTQRQLAASDEASRASGWAYAGWLIAVALLAAVAVLVGRIGRPEHALRQPLNGRQATDEALVREVVSRARSRQASPSPRRPA